MVSCASNGARAENPSLRLGLVHGGVDDGRGEETARDGQACVPECLGPGALVGQREVLSFGEGLVDIVQSHSNTTAASVDDIIKVRLRPRKPRRDEVVF